jgi:hypothetical protein
VETEKRRRDAPVVKRLSDFGLYVKGFGALLNFNCSILLFPVSRSVLRWLYNRSTFDQGVVSRPLRFALKLKANARLHRIVPSRRHINASTKHTPTNNVAPSRSSCS